MSEQSSSNPEPVAPGPETIGEILSRHGGLPEIDEAAEAARKQAATKAEVAARLRGLIEQYQAQQALRQGGVETDPKEDQAIELALGQAFQDAEAHDIELDDQDEA